jgi:hypothetical protein
MASLPRLLALPLALVVGCTGADDGGDLGEAGVAAATYELTTTVDATDALPAIAAEAIELLGGLADDPAGTLIGLLEAADLPIVDQVLGAIPAALRGSVEGWINDFIFDQLYMGVPVTEEIARWAQDLSGILTHFEIASRMDMGNVAPAGDASANHTLAGVAFDFRGSRQLVNAPDIVGQLTMARDVSCQLASTEGGGAAIDIGDHAFHMPLGDFAVVGFNMGLQQLAGFSDLRDALGSVIDCAALAQSVASRCILSVCVGHAAEIEQLCVAGIDLLASEVERRIASIDYAELRLASGQAALVSADKQDAGGALRFDRIDDGSWQAAVDVDGLVVPVGATFVGRRLGADSAPE